MSFQIRGAVTEDRDQLFSIYRLVADQRDGIIREKSEITPAFIDQIFKSSLDRGLMLVAVDQNEVIGAIHAYTPGIRAFRHILSDLTIVVHPRYQGKGIGTELFNTFLERVKRNFSHILRVELFTREHNKKNVEFYRRLGFVNEGRQERKIFLKDDKFHTPLHMAWFNPNFGSW